MVFQEIARFRALLFDRLIAPHGLTMSQAWVLVHLFKEDGLTQREIAARMEIGTVALSGLVDRLEARGLVERRADPADRRAKRVCLLPAAKPLGRAMNQCNADVDAVAFAGLADEDVDTLLSLLERVRGNLLDNQNRSESAAE